MRERLVVATTNAGKLREIRELLGDIAIELVALTELPGVPPPDEDGTTFEANARLKALYYARHTPDLTVAEDSGLVIDALDGAPGIHSARFLGEGATYQERFSEISRQLARRPDAARSARFVCALAVARGERILFETTQSIEGEIAAEPAGTDGFGYDPIFLYPPYGRTLAQVSRQEKLAVAHRGKAFRMLRTWLVAHRRGIDVG